MLRSSVRICNESHLEPHCYPCQNGEPHLPSRVLDLSTDVVKVVDARERCGHYATLSHHWGGGKRPVCLTKASLTRFQDVGIPFSELPKTYQDAITITRGLEENIRHLWIDSLCIIQDNADDWRAQSSQMQDVYGRGYLNICATHATSSNQGCFAHVLSTATPRANKLSNSRVVVREARNQSHLDYGVNYRFFEPRGKPPAPLLKRAWVLQERLPAPRVVYYDGAELLWECKAMHDCLRGGITILAGFKHY